MTINKSIITYLHLDTVPFNAYKLIAMGNKVLKTTHRKCPSSQHTTQLNAQNHAIFSLDCDAISTIHSRWSLFYFFDPPCQHFDLLSTVGFSPQHSVFNDSTFLMPSTHSVNFYGWFHLIESLVQNLRTLFKGESFFCPYRLLPFILPILFFHWPLVSIPNGYTPPMLLRLHYCNLAIVLLISSLPGNSY